MKEERYFKCYEFKHLMTDCTVKKQKVSNVVEKNDTESVFIRKKISKECSSSATDNESEN